MMRNIIAGLVLCGGLLSMCGDVYGAEGVNRQIPFHGSLQEGSSTTPSGTYDMTFAIYDVATGGAPLWTGTYTDGNSNPVTVENGEFKVMLGSGSGNDLNLDFNSDTYYLGITVETDSEMTPRERLGATGYAINSDLLDGYHASSFLMKDTPFQISNSTDTPLIALTQSGSGDLMSLYNGSGDLLFSVLNSGRVLTNSFESVIDELNVFAGAIEVQSGDDSSFGGNVTLADGAGLQLGNGNGITLYQDISGIGSNNLMFLPTGEAFFDGSVNLMAPKTLTILANTDFDGSGDMQPGIELGDTGLTRMYNMSGFGDPRLELSYTDGIEVTDGGILVSGGSLVTTDTGIKIAGGGTLRIGSGDAQEALDVDGVIRASSLAGGVFPLESDADGNIIANPSDERLKKNIHTIDGALDMLLKLRGVRYDWRDPERFGSSTQVGFIAQEVQEVIPEVVKDSGEYLSLDTKNITAVIVEAVKELYVKVNNYFARTEQLEQEVMDLRQELDALKAELHKTNSSQNNDEELNADEPTQSVLIDEEILVDDASPTEESQNTQEATDESSLPNDQSSPEQNEVPQDSVTE